MSNLRKIREFRRISQGGLGSLLSPPLTSAAISHFELGKRRMNDNTLRQLAKILQCSISQIVGDEEFDESSYSISSNIVHVPQYNIKDAAGDGVEVENELIDGLVAFKKDYLASKGITDYDSLALIRVPGNSMAPTLRDGDFVMLDRNRIEITEGLYVIRIGNALKVKRIMFDPFKRTVRIISDNKEAINNDRVFPDYEVRFEDLINNDDIAVIGKVCWHCGDL